MRIDKNYFDKFPTYMEAKPFYITRDYLFKRLEQAGIDPNSKYFLKWVKDNGVDTIQGKLQELNDEEITDAYESFNEVYYALKDGMYDLETAERKFHKKLVGLINHESLFQYFTEMITDDDDPMPLDRLVFGNQDTIYERVWDIDIQKMIDMVRYKEQHNED